MSEGFHRPFVPVTPVLGAGLVPVRRTGAGGFEVWARRVSIPDAAAPPFDDGELAVVRRALQGAAPEGVATTLAGTLGLDPRVAPVPAGAWTSPPYAPVRWALTMFFVPVPEGQEIAADGCFRDAEAWLDGLSRGRAYPGPLLARLCRALVGAGTLERAAEALSAPASTQVMELGGDVYVLPVQTPTLPPATHTNCVVLGGGRTIIVDPASPYQDEQQRLLTFLEGRMERGDHIDRIVLTHHHHDHVGAVQALRRHFDVAVVAHPATAERLGGRAHVDELLLDGDRLPFGAPAANRSLRAVHTPGHAPGHVILVDDGTGVTIAGDMVAGFGTIVVDPPEGDMAQYLRSLERMKALSARLLVPAHGPVITDPSARLTEYIRHRLWREGRIVSVLRERGSLSVADLVPFAYDDVQPAVHPLAARQALAHLLKLRDEGLARETDDGRWWVM